MINEFDVIQTFLAGVVSGGVLTRLRIVVNILLLIWFFFKGIRFTVRVFSFLRRKWLNTRDKRRGTIIASEADVDV